MSRILAIDTTSSFGSIAIAEDEQIIEEVPMHSPEGFSEILYQRLDELLARHAWSLGNVDCFASASGPGSFTGVRVGLTAVKGLAEATGKRAVGVSNLQALAVDGVGDRRAIVLDARRGEVYGAVYDSELKIVSPEVVMPFRQWWESVRAHVPVVVTHDAAVFRALLPPEVDVVERRCLAAAVARIAREVIRSGKALDPAALDANYIRRSDAELLWRDPGSEGPRLLAKQRKS